jgi:hypothetical protein
MVMKQTQFEANIRKYGLTLETRQKLIDGQGNKCAICKLDGALCRLPGPKKQYGLVIDHCHKTKRVRGMLCHSCNTLLSNARDNPDTLYSALSYLSSPLPIIDPLPTKSKRALKTVKKPKKRKFSHESRSAFRNRIAGQYTLIDAVKMFAENYGRGNGIENTRGIYIA